MIKKRKTTLKLLAVAFVSPIFALSIGEEVH